MITEQDQEKSTIKELEKSITFWEEVISKAEKYERLADNTDWKGFLNDLKILAEVHEREVKWAATMLPDAPSAPYMRHDTGGKEILVSSKSDWCDFMQRHEIQRAECLKWVKEPELVVAKANLAREKLPFLKEKLAELKSHAPVPAAAAE